MANRRLARGSRTLSKKKAKIAKKATLASEKGFSKKSAVPTSGRLRIKATRKINVRSPTTKFDAIMKQRSATRKQHAAERMVLKEHLRDLENRRARIRKGENAKSERRELGKYIRQLKEEQRVKHLSELTNLQTELQRLLDAAAQRKATGISENDDWEDVADEELESVGEDELQDMFAHLIA